MATRASRLTGSQEESIRGICEIGELPLARLARRLEELELIISSEKIRQIIIDEVGKKNGEHLASFLFSVAVAHRRDSGSPEATLSNINKFIDQRSAREARFEAWPKCVPILAILLRSKSIRAATKALDVSYDFERIYLEGRFLTSLRPIFDETRAKIVGATVVQTLRVEYMSTEGDRSSLSIAVDKTDITKLRDLCNTALLKGDETFRAASEDWLLPTIMPGELGS